MKSAKYAGGTYSQVHGHEKMSKTRSYVVTEKFQKLACLRAQKNAKNSQVLGHETMLKTQRSAVTENCQKCLRQQSCKNSKNSQFRYHKN